jgi:phosphoribosylaminoimidazole-succinocarboxamide synthase
LDSESVLARYPTMMKVTMTTVLPVVRTGVVLTELSLFWFDRLRNIIPKYVVTSRVEEMPEDRNKLEGRSILVKKAEVEAIVLGYITGEQQQHFTVSKRVDSPAYPVFLFRFRMV